MIDLAQDLYEVSQWYSFGLHLNVPPNILKEIQQDHQTVEMRRNAVFDWWLNRTQESERTWATIVNALSQSGYMALAEKLAVKYGEQNDYNMLEKMDVISTMNCLLSQQVCQFLVFLMRGRMCLLQHNTSHW